MSIAKLTRQVCLATLCAAIPAAAQNHWGTGVLFGGSMYLDKDVTGSSGSGKTGAEKGFAAGGFLGHDSTNYLGGEIRYLFAKNDLRLSSGSTTYKFAAQTHAIHYDLLIHFAGMDSSVRPFVAIGGGMKLYKGTGPDNPSQPLQNVAILTHTQQWEPLGTFGGGVKIKLGGRAVFRVEVRDYTTPVPKDVILPVPPNKISGWMHNITPLAALSVQFP